METAQFRVTKSLNANTRPLFPPGQKADEQGKKPAAAIALVVVTEENSGTPSAYRHVLGP